MRRLRIHCARTRVLLVRVVAVGDAGGVQGSPCRRVGVLEKRVLVLVGLRRRLVVEATRVVGGDGLGELGQQALEVAHKVVAAREHDGGGGARVSAEADRDGDRLAALGRHGAHGFEMEGGGMLESWKAGELESWRLAGGWASCGVRASGEGVRGGPLVSTRGWRRAPRTEVGLLVNASHIQKASTECERTPSEKGNRHLSPNPAAPVLRRGHQKHTLAKGYTLSELLHNTRIELDSCTLQTDDLSKPIRERQFCRQAQY